MDLYFEAVKEIKKVLVNFWQVLKPKPVAKKEKSNMRINQPRLSGNSGSASAELAPKKVDVSMTERTVGDVRTITIKLPAKKILSQRELDALAAKEGKPVVAICDLSGLPIFNDKNVNEVHNPERPEFDHMVISTTIMKELAKLKL